MVDIPAVCNKCGSFFPSGFAFENVTKLTLSGNMSGPCPFCGVGMGLVLDGVFNIVGNSITLLSGPQRTIEQLKRLAEILQRARQEGASRDEIVTKLEEEGLSSLAAVIPKNRIELYAFLMIFVVLILGVIQHCSLKATEPAVEIDSITIQQGFSPEEVQQLLNEVLEKVNPPSPETLGTPEQPRTPDDMDDPDKSEDPAKLPDPQP